MQFGTMKVDQYLDRYVNEIMKLEHKEITYAEIGLDRLYINKFAKNQSRFEEIKSKINLQNNMFRIMKEELLKLGDQFREVGIPMVVLKGVPLAMELYNANPGVRKSNDIDLLFSPFFIEQALDILGENDYFVADTEMRVSRELVSLYADKMKVSIHYPVFKKKIVIDGCEKLISMDCHTRIFHLAEDKSELTVEMIKRATEFYIDDRTLYILEIHDRILHLILHLAKEYFRNLIRWNINGERFLSGKRKFPFNLLHEIARLIEIHSKEIKWELLIERMRSYDINEEVWCVFKLLNIVYEDIIPYVIIANPPQLKANEVDKTWGCFYPLQMMLNTDINILPLDLDEVAEEYFENISLSERFYFGREYVIKNMHNNQFVAGCELTKEVDVNSVAKVCIEKEVDGISIKIRDLDTKLFNKVIITWSSLEKDRILNAYINRYIVDLIGIDFNNFIPMYACNAFVDLEFKENAYLVDGVLVIKLKFDKCEKILLDIDFDYGQCESGKPLKKNVSKPRHMNNIFMYSPTLLKEFIEEY